MIFHSNISQVTYDLKINFVFTLVSYIRIYNIFNDYKCLNNIS